MKYIFVINGSPSKTEIRQAVERQLEELKAKIAERNDTTSVYISTGVGDATRYVRIYNDLHQKEHVCFVACGGSGTINEVASGIVGFQNKELAIFTGNHVCDVIRYYPDRKFDSISEIMDSPVKKIDIIKVNDNYCLNMCNIGLDARIAYNVNVLTANNVKDPYKKAIRRGLLVGRYNYVKVVADGKQIGHNLLTLCTFANGKYIGDGMLGAPRSVNDDGLIDICYLKPMSLLRLIISMKFYREGRHFDTKFISNKFLYRRARKIQVYSPKILDICLDGEMSLGSSLDIEILPNELPLRLPKIK